jgi:5-formyltetrahydrofolate cyclo-ligase
MDQHLDKITLRKKLLAQRRSRTVAEWRTESDRVCQILKRDRSFSSAKQVLAYFSTRQELDLSSLWIENSQIPMSQMIQTGHPTGHQTGHPTARQTFGFPRCEGQNLQWHGWEPGDALVMGSFGIQEPDRSSRRLDPQDVDLMLVPCVGCDRAGYRLGYGGGFYDRLLADLAWRSVPTIGIVWPEAIVDHLPAEPWDIPLTRVCSNPGFLSLNNQ